MVAPHRWARLQRLAFQTLIAAMFVMLPAARSVIAAAPETSPEFPPAAIEFFEKEVRPLMAAACYECHSRDAKTLRGGLMLDARADILKGGDTGAAIVPGKPKESLLVDAINYGDTYQMPPKKRLAPEQIAVLTKWVEMGAPWPKETTKVDPKKFDLIARRSSHWCWQPVKPQTPPAVKNAAWPKQPLDQFILAKLEAKGIAPAAQADKRALIRRAYFDVIGLPPTWDEVAAFAADDSPKAFEKVVDRLLESPHFGERWARHWMDLVRYAETYGHEFDYPLPYAPQYRDYLIRAFNADVPYNQFVKEHIAGDLLPHPRLNPKEGFNESIIGTGFWWFGEATHAPVDVAGDECTRIDNQIDVMSKTFLGVTVACARCHDHKFDAITTKDFYALSGFLKSSRRQDAPLDPQGKIHATVAEMRKTKATVDQALRTALPPTSGGMRDDIAKSLIAAWEVVSTNASDLDVISLKNGVPLDHLKRWVAALRDPEIKEPTHPIHAWHAVLQEKGPVKPVFFERLKKKIEDGDEKAVDAQKNSQLFADFERGSFDGWFVTGEAFGQKPTVASEWNAASRAAQAAPQAVRPGVAHSGILGGKLHGTLRSPTFTLSHKQIHYRMAGDNVQIRVVIDGYFMAPFNGLLFGGVIQKVDKKPDYVWVTQGGDLGRYIGQRAYIEVLDQGDGFAAIDEVRFSDVPPPAEKSNPLAAATLRGEGIDSVSKLAESTAGVFDEVAKRWQVGKADRYDTELVNWALRHQLLANESAGSTLSKQVAAAGKRLDELTAALPAPRYALAMCDGNGQNDHVHVRGSHRKMGEEAPRRLLEALEMPTVPNAELGSGRLLLAEQMVDSNNPLTARVLVNRVWQHLFGRGIVASVDNFGVLGQEPTHRELLDYLAISFQRGGDDFASTNRGPRSSGKPTEQPWSLKHLIRTLLLSSTYQMSSAPTKPGDDLDPLNLLIHRANIRRLEGEVIRDGILKISGRLDPTVGGSSVGVHLTPFMQGRGRPGGSGPLDGNGRRSLYTEVRRNFLPPMMLAFDTPIPFSSVGARNVSNVPAQALILMNDPLVVQQADVWAKRLLAAKHPSAEERIAAIYEDAYSRPPTSIEVAGAMDFLQQQARELNVPPDKIIADQKLWADLCHVLMNVKEFIFVN